FSVEVAGSTEGSAKPAAGEFRMWTEQATGRQVDARVTGFVDGTVHLERRDGQRFALPITRFCEEDQTRIRGAFQPE
ncbi:MAG: SHD1 domain-containing protein, partial [Pirellulaceae bacterium]|nr:SHD1 domain-containing protein [Pirellulaceae bacterium]